MDVAVDEGSRGEDFPLSEGEDECEEEAWVEEEDCPCG